MAMALPPLTPKEAAQAYIDKNAPVYATNPHGKLVVVPEFVGWKAIPPESILMFGDVPVQVHHHSEAGGKFNPAIKEHGRSDLTQIHTGRTLLSLGGSRDSGWCIYRPLAAWIEITDSGARCMEGDVGVYEGGSDAAAAAAGQDVGFVCNGYAKDGYTLASLRVAESDSKLRLFRRTGLRTFTRTVGNIIWAKPLPIP